MKRVKIATKAMRQKQNPNKPKFSKYAKKSKFLATHGGFGMDYPDKPWKGHE
jgi:hypothetical protein